MENINKSKIAAEDKRLKSSNKHLFFSILAGATSGAGTSSNLSIGLLFAYSTDISRSLLCCLCST